MLQMGYLYLTNPRKDEALFNAWKEKQKSSIQFAMSDPQTAFIDSVYQVMYQKNPLAPVAVPKPAYYDAINLDRSLAIYKELLGDASEFTWIKCDSIE